MTVVEERAFARVGVADQGDRGHGNGLAALALLAAHAAHGFQIALELIDAALDATAVGFELRLAGSAGADAAAQLRHGFAAPGQPRQHVFKLRQLHLQLALAGARVAGKDVEDQLRPVEHAARQRGLKVAQLRGCKVVVEENQVGVGGCGDAGNLLHLAGTDERCGIGARAALQHLGGNLPARAQQQFAKFGERFLGIETGEPRARRHRTLRARGLSEQSRLRARTRRESRHTLCARAAMTAARLSRERTPRSTPTRTARSTRSAPPAVRGAAVPVRRACQSSRSTEDAPALSLFRSRPEAPTAPARQPDRCPTTRQPGGVRYESRSGCSPRLKSRV